MNLNSIVNNGIFEDKMRRKPRWKENERKCQLSTKSFVSNLSPEKSTIDFPDTVTSQAFSNEKRWQHLTKVPGSIGTENAQVDERSNNWQDSWKEKVSAGFAKDDSLVAWSKKSAKEIPAWSKKRKISSSWNSHDWNQNNAEFSRSLDSEVSHPVDNSNGNPQTKFRMADVNEDSLPSKERDKWPVTNREENSKRSQYLASSNNVGNMKEERDVLIYNHLRKKQRYIESSNNESNELISWSKRIENKTKGHDLNQQSLSNHESSTILQNIEKNSHKTTNSSQTNLSSTANIDKNIVFADGIVLVDELFLKGKQKITEISENYQISIPWPGRILGENECKDMFSRTGFRAKLGDVLVWLYFPPPSLGGCGETSSFDPQHQWKKLVCVHEMQLQQFSEHKKEKIENYFCSKEHESDKEINLINSFWKAWTIVAGLRKWACGAGLEKNDKYAKSLNNQVGEYGAVLAIERYKWIEGSKEDDPDVIVNMIQSHKVSCFLNTYNPLLSEKILEKREMLEIERDYLEQERCNVEHSPLPARDSNLTQEKIGASTTQNDELTFFRMGTNTLSRPANELKSNDHKYKLENETITLLQNEISHKESNNAMITPENDTNSITVSPKCALTNDNSKNKIQDAQGIKKLNFVKADGICLVVGKDETRSTHRPWPARIMCAKESLKWRSCQKKLGNVIPDNHVTVVYYFPFFEGMSTNNCTERWYSYSSVEPSRIFEFDQNVSDISYTSDELYMRFMRGWVVAEGLQYWSYGVNLQKPKSKVKGQEKINPVHAEVADYGFVLSIDKESWVRASQRLNPKDVVQMICDFEIIKSRATKYDQSRTDAMMRKTSKEMHEDGTELSKEGSKMDHVPTSEQVTNLNKTTCKTNAVFHDLFNVMDESKGGGRLTNGEKVANNDGTKITPSPVLSDNAIASNQGLDQKSIAPLFRQYKNKVLTKESKDLYEGLECLSKKSTNLPSWIYEVLHSMSSRIIALEKEIQMNHNQQY